MELLTDAQRALFGSGGCLADYDVFKPIGKGKFSVVFKAQRRKDGVAVALKKIAIFDLMDARAREKTLKEVRLVQSVEHENIVQYLDAFLNGKELHIAFEWADAGDLKRQIRKANERQVRLDERTIWRYFTQLCAAILHLHRARIMHRDLKPANILLTTQGIVKVGDLGLGRHLSEDTLEAHSKVGTPLYMSPEVLKGEGYDWKSDVWSLGCILYELAMLRSPFKSEGLNLYGLFQKINKGDYEAVPDSYSTHLRTLVTRMISLDATRRPTMEQVWDACQTRPSTATVSTECQPVLPPPQKAAPQRSRNNDDGGVGVGGGRTQSNASPTPAPSPASSRPTSQQSDGVPHSAHSSRPGSSEKSSTPQLSQQRKHAAAPAPAVSEEELAQRQEEGAMELLYERLKLLPGGSDATFHRRLTRHHFASESRGAPQWTPSPYERFRELCRVTTWLLALIDEPLTTKPQPDEDQDDQAAVVRAQKLLLAAERAGVKGAELAGLSAASLTQGCGLDTVVFLNALSEKALETTCSRRQRPVYPRDAVDTIEADEHWEVQSDDHEAASGGGDTTASTSLLDDEIGEIFGGTDANWLVVRESERYVAVNKQDDVAMIHSSVDPHAWRREVERVQHKLADRWRESEAHAGSSSSASVWIARLEALQRDNRAIARTREPTCDALARSSQARARESEQIRLMEHQLFLTKHEATGRQLRDGAARLRHSQHMAQQLQLAVDDRAAALRSLEAVAHDRIQRLQEANARVSDATPLVQIRTQLRRLTQENDALRVQTEVARSQFWRVTSVGSRPRIDY